MSHDSDRSAIDELLARRRFIQRAGWGTLVVAFGGASWILAEDLTRDALAETRKDGKPRLPPGQRVLRRLKPMGGEPGDPRLSAFRLKVHGEVEKPFSVSFAELLKLPQVDAEADVHCVTGWSVLGARVRGVRVSELAKRAKPTRRAHHVIFEAAHGYTANVPLRVALEPNVMVVHRLEDQPLPRTHGGPARALVPDRYFWKSAKWLTGIRFVERDEPGYWERRGYHNRADPWREERHG